MWLYAVHLCVYLGIFVCMYLCVCVCVHVCEYVHTYMQVIVGDKDSQYFQSKFIAIMFTNNNTGYFRIVRF